jgi:Caspase domain
VRRRDLLAVGVLAAGTFAAKSLFAQQNAPPTTRAAVVIGVDKVGGLPILSAAKSGAKEVANWLESEGFDVKPLVDDGKAVTVRDVSQAVKEFVNRSMLTHLVIYFAGHGFLKGRSELWMLSGAPDDANEAISFPECYTFALSCGIRNVTFIADACRLPTTDLVMGGVRGATIFPNLPPARFPTDVDVLFACLPGQPSIEVSVPDALGYQGIYTACLLAAYKQPDATMTQMVDGKLVVPNRKLKPYLEREVRQRAAAKPIRMNQFPQTLVTSSDDTYLGKALPVEKSLAPPPRREGTIFDVAERALKNAGVQTLGVDSIIVPPITNLDEVARETGFDRTLAAIGASAQAPDHSETGFTILGVSLALAITHPAIQTGLLALGSANATGVRVELNGKRACSVALRFADGTGTILAALQGFIGTLVVDRGNIINVSYSPSPNNPLWSGFQQERERLVQMHAAVAAAARFGVFQIDGDKETRSRKAEELGDRIRVLKSIDPTLGLYAAYAYADANLVHKARSVDDFMRGDLNLELFDIALASGNLSGRRPGADDSIFPFCPMLTQGWGLLAAKNARLPGEIAEAQDHVRTSLWTILDQTGMDIVIRPLREGRLR